MQTSQPNRTIDEFAADDQQGYRSLGLPTGETRAVISSNVEKARAHDPIFNSSMSAMAKEELARDLGYSSVGQMMEQTEAVPLPMGAFVYLTTDSDGYWVSWYDKPFYDLRRFESRRSALSTLRESTEPIFSQS